MKKGWVMKRVSRAGLALLAVSLLSALLAAPAYADTVEPRSWTWAWLLAGAVVAMIVAAIAWWALAGLRRRRSDEREDDSAKRAGREPPR